MSFIIAATDFSPVAENAVRYACGFAQQYSLPVIIIHSFIVPVAFGDTPMPVLPVDDARDIAQERMNELMSNIKSEFPEVKAEGKIAYGDIIDCLVDYEGNTKPWLVFLGNSGSGNTQLWLGSNVVSALKNKQINVVAVPSGYTYRKINKICLATDLKDGNDIPIHQIVDIVQNTGTVLHVLNVETEDSTMPVETPIEITRLREGLADIAPEFHYETNEDIDKGINEFIEQHQMDWLLIIPHRHNFFENLFRKSHTNKLVQISSVPVVAIH